MNGLVEVGPLPVITPLPHLPPWILGIVNVRSEIVSVVDLAGFLGLPKDSNQRDEQLVIIKHQDVRTGIPIERVYGTVNRSRSDQIIPLPAEIVGERKAFFVPKGFMVDDQMYSIFDIQQLFTSHRFLKYHQTM